MSPKFGLDEIKLMVKLVHSKITKEQIGWVLQLAALGIDKQNADELYDILITDVLPDHTPPCCQLRAESAVTDYESPPSSQGYPAICSDNESSNRPAEIDSPPYIDEDPWAGLPKDPNYIPRYNYLQHLKSHRADHDDSNATSANTTISNITNNHHHPINNTHHINSVEKRARDRFVFRGCHHDILNNAFSNNAYPENDDKEILVDRCNQALEDFKKRPLKENEKMTILNITNWFNNRRKEMKRKLHEPQPERVNKIVKEDSKRVKQEVMSEQEDDF